MCQKHSSRISKGGGRVGIVYRVGVEWGSLQGGGRVRVVYRVG